MGVFSLNLRKAFYITELEDREYFLKAMVNAFNSLLDEFEKKLLESPMAENGIAVNSSGAIVPIKSNDIFVITYKNRIKLSDVKKALWNEDTSGAMERLFEQFGKVFKSKFKKIDSFRIKLIPLTESKIFKKEVDVSSFSRYGKIFVKSCRAIGSKMNPDKFASMMEEHIKKAIREIKISPKKISGQCIEGTFTGVAEISLGMIYGNV